jgi:ribosomal protein S18 acetylase RimI-like enzyme
MTYLPKLHTDDEIRGWLGRVVFPESRVWVAERGGRIEGFAALRDGRIDHLYVRPGSQSAGVGAALLREAKRASPDELTLYVFQRNVRARAFYERHGFLPVSFGDGSGNEENEPDVLMRWPGDVSGPVPASG